MSLQHTKLYFLGIGGIGMSALARWLWSTDVKVGGYDRTPSAITDEMMASGIDISFDESPDKIPDWVKQDPEGCLIVRTPAVPDDHKGLMWLKNNHFSIIKRAELLGRITDSYKTLAVAGTHGKTTTSAILTWILHDSGIPCGAFLGGISANLGSNMLAPPALGCIVVVEADEYDRSFLQLKPHAAILTSMDADHLDVYGSSQAVVNSFHAFTKLIPAGGTLVHAATCDPDTKSGVLKLSYSLDSHSTIKGVVKSVESGCLIFDYHAPELSIEHIKLPMPGLHNVENTCAAITLALAVGCTPERIKSAIAAFKGVGRRFELIGKSDTYIFYDDYAHHPTEIKAFIRSIRYLYPDQYLTIIFQPHLFTRTRDFAEGFANELDHADEVILLDIYPARELPIPGVSSKMLLEKMTNTNKRIVTKEQLVDKSQNFKYGIVATLGAGDIDRLINSLKINLHVS